MRMNLYQYVFIKDKQEYYFVVLINKVKLWYFKWFMDELGYIEQMD